MKTVEETARYLAQCHLEDDPGLQLVKWSCRNNPEAEILLLEITSNVRFAGQAFPFRFSAGPPDVPFASVMLVMHPKEWELVRLGELKLPQGWESCESWPTLEPAPVV